jgi:hypothetical protein
MSRPRPWWTTYPKELWSAENRRAARKAGVVLPPLPQPADIDQPIRPLVPHGQLEVAISLYGDPGRNAAERRRRAANEVLAKAGLRPRPWT